MTERQTVGDGSVREKVKDAIEEKAAPVTQVTDATVCQMAATVASGLVLPVRESGLLTWQASVQQEHMVGVAKLAVACAQAIVDAVAARVPPAVEQVPKTERDPSLP